MQFNIAICDNDTDLRDKLELNLKKNHFGDINSIKKYKYDIELINDIQYYSTYFDIIILSLNKPVSDSLKTVKTIQSIKVFNNCIFIFMSSSDIYASKIFNLHPFAFFTKPINISLFENIINDLISSFLTKENLIVFSTRKRNLILNQNEIIHIKTNHRNCDIITVNSNYSFPMSMAQIEEQLYKKNDSFIRIHASHIVNIHYISQIFPIKVEMTNGNILPISRTYRDNFIKYYNQFMMSSKNIIS